MLNKRHTNHFGHFILSVLFFPWVIAWIVFHLNNQRHNDEIDRLMWTTAMQNKG
uniref:Uncharacterized protein n=2 Tax=unclassified bacterial viruses TaxID=12333 RepID=A0AAU6VY26_9VIRU